jgi:hypothetical protein
VPHCARRDPSPTRVSSGDVDDAVERRHRRGRGRADRDLLPSSSTAPARAAADPARAAADLAAIQKDDTIDDRADAKRARTATASPDESPPPMITFDDMFIDALDGFTTYTEAKTNTVPPVEAATGRGALPRRFCKSCRKALDVFRDFDGELKTCRLCLRVRKKDAKRKRALRRADAKRSGDGDGKKGAAS